MSLLRLILHIPVSFSTPYIYFIILHVGHYKKKRPHNGEDSSCLVQVRSIGSWKLDAAYQQRAELSSSSPAM